MIRTSFSIIGDPVGKPAWQKSDKWLTGDDMRPAVRRYRDWCDKAREAATGSAGLKLDATHVIHIYIFSHVRMPATWSKKEKERLAGSMHRSKPDSDNITKAVKDALFDEDKFVSGDTSLKFWAYDDEEARIDLFIIVLPGMGTEPAKEEADCAPESEGDGVE